jgi:hypothetical protein
MRANDVPEIANGSFIEVIRQLTRLTGNRDDKVHDLSELITRPRSGVRSIYDRNSVQYEQSAHVRLIEMRSFPASEPGAVL